MLCYGGAVKIARHTAIFVYDARNQVTCQGTGIPLMSDCKMG